MCGRFYVPEDDSVRMLRKTLDDLASRNIRVSTGELCPGDVAAVIARNRRLEQQPFAMNWGYHLPDGKLVFNTRSESAAGKPMFVDGIQQRRCVVPAAYYYEWEKSEAGKSKYAIQPVDVNGFYLGGIYRIENRIPVFSILTQSPTSEISFIHNRMPVIIPEAILGDWLNPRFSAIEIINSIHNNMTFSKCG